MSGSLGLLGLPNPLDAASGLATGIASALLSGLGTSISSAISSGAREAISGVISLINNSAGVVSFDPSSWWGKEVGTTTVGSTIWATMIELGLGTLAICLILAVIQGIRAGDPMLGIRAVAVELPASIFGMVAVIGLTTALVSATDAASAAVLPKVASDFGAWAGANATFFATVVAGFTLLGALAVWVELVVRSGLIFLLVALSPLTLAVRVWPAAAGVWRRSAEVGVALILTKFAIALALALGAAALAGSVDGTLSATSATTGAGLMLVAAMSPFVLFRILPGLEGAMGAAGISRMPLRAAHTGLSVAASSMMLARLAGGSGLGVPAGSATATGPTGATGASGSSLARAVSFDVASRPAGTASPPPPGALSSPRAALGPASPPPDEASPQ